MTFEHILIQNHWFISTNLCTNHLLVKVILICTVELPLHLQKKDNGIDFLFLQSRWYKQIHFQNCQLLGTVLDVFNMNHVFSFLSYPHEMVRHTVLHMPIIFFRTFSSKMKILVYLYIILIVHVKFEFSK